MPALALFPWIAVESPETFGRFRLLPFAKGALPGNQAHVTQADIEGVFAPYATPPNRPIDRATMVEVGDWKSGMEVTQEIVDDLYQFQNFLAFSALSKRQLFSLSWNYTNTDAFALIIQNFKAGDTRHFAFTTRRRDGGTSQMWGADGFAFYRPSHVLNGGRLDLDEKLLNALVTQELPDKVIDAITAFNQANTDSSSVSIGSEAVFCKSAFELLFDINSDIKEFHKHIDIFLSKFSQRPADGPLKDEWLHRWPKETSLLKAWAKDFHVSRGVAAHSAAGASNVYGLHQHLAFVAVLFPFLVKLVLSGKGQYEMQKWEEELLKYLEQLLVHNPFAFDHHAAVNEGKQHPWREVLTVARMSAIRYEVA